MLMVESLLFIGAGAGVGAGASQKRTGFATLHITIDLELETWSSVFFSIGFFKNCYIFIKSYYWLLVKVYELSAFLKSKPTSRFEEEFFEFR